MARDGVVGFGDAHTARLAEIAHAVAAADAAISAAHATMTRLLADASDLAREVASGAPRAVRDRDMAERAVASELGAALRVSDRTVQARMDAAATLTTDYPQVVDALAAGRIHTGHVRTITDAGMPLPADRRRVLDAHAVAVERVRWFV